jgi:hypothetical protein
MGNGRTKRAAVRRCTQVTKVAILCPCLFSAAAGAHPAIQSSHTHAEWRARLNQMDWDALWGSAVERKLDDWVPTKENNQVPMAAIRSPQTDISGTWEVHGHLTGSSLTVTRSGPDSYDITFYTHGCTAQWKLRRTAHYSGGALVLNRPVEEYDTLIYQKLYAVRVGGTEYLVPDVALGRFQDSVASDGTWVPEGLWRGYCAFTRTPPPDASKRGQTAPRPDKPQ